MFDFSLALDTAKGLAPKLQGRSFVLLMGHHSIRGKGTTLISKGRPEFTDFHIVPRDSLPCWGELRRYKSSHKDCTRPEDSRPHDLFQPFPDGTPYGIVIGMRNWFNHNKYTDVIRRVITEGPWKSILGDKVEVTDDYISITSYNTGLNGGLKLDSTVLVSLLAFIGRINDWFVQTLSFLPLEEAIASQMHVCNRPEYGVSSNPYYFARISPRRISQDDPRMLSEGSMKDLFDYNRKRLQDVFGADQDEPHLDMVTHFSKLIVREGTSRKYTGPIEIEEYCKAFSEYYNSILQQELRQDEAA